MANAKDEKVNKGEQAGQTGFDVGKLNPQDLLKLVKGMNQDQLRMVRAAAGQVIPLDPATTGGFAILPDGSIRISVEVPSDLAPALREWADAAGEPIEQFLKHYCVEALNAYSMMDWGNAAAASPSAAAPKT